jgi:hypothetical protein
MIGGVTAWALVACGVAAAEPGDAADLLRSLSGTWRGELVYRDYQSNERTALPVTRTVALLPDKATLYSLSAFDDGASGTVYITSLEGLDAKTGAWQSTSIRTNQAVQTSSQTIALTRQTTSTTDWSVTLTEDGEDNDAPAVIRETVTRSGDTLTVLKEVDPKDDRQDLFLFRNETTLTRQP